MIQYHMNEILECQHVVDEYRLMADEGRELIPLESDMHRRDPVVIQHTMQMIDTDIHWHKQTFRDIIMELRKLWSGETPTKPNEETSKTAMMCWVGKASMNPNKQVRNERRTLKTMNQVEMPTKWMIRRPPCPRIQQLWQNN